MRIQILCSALLVTVFALGVASFEWDFRGPHAFTVPVLLWSGKPIFTPSQAQIVDTLSTQDVEYTLSSLLLKSPMNKQSSVAPTFSGSKQPTEVVVLFIEPELSTDQISRAGYEGYLSNLRNEMGNAASSLTMPYATVDRVSLFDDALTNIVGSISGSILVARMPNSKLFKQLGQQNNVKIVNIDSLLDELRSSSVFSNKVTDLVVVCFDKDPTFSSHDEIIGAVSSSIKTATNGNYVAVYSANMPADSRIFWTFEQHSEAEFSQHIQISLLGNGTNNSTNTTTTINYFPGALIEAYLLSAILLAMLFTGGCAIFSLQTPDKWDAPKVKREQY